MTVIPAQAGIQYTARRPCTTRFTTAAHKSLSPPLYPESLDSRLRGNDVRVVKLEVLKAALCRVA